MKRRAAALLFTLALAACATKPAPSVAPTQAEWDAVSAADYTCGTGEFVSPSFETVMSAPQAYVEKCVRLRALLSGNTLYRDATRLKAARPLGHEQDGMIGVYAKDAKLLAALASHPQFVTASGRLRSCAERLRKMQSLAERAATAQKSGTDAIPVHPIDGFCKAGGGPALYLTAIAPIPTAMD